MKVTEEKVEEAIVNEEYHKLGTKMTACVLTLEDGFEVVGLAGVVDASTYDMSIGSKFARVKAKDKVWEHLGSILQYKLSVLAEAKRKTSEEFLDAAVGYFLTESIPIEEVQRWQKEGINPNYLTEDNEWMNADDLLEAVIEHSDTLLYEYTKMHSVILK